ncbi:MAG: phytochrome sensor protein [Gallionellales bacterium RIFCSPLOWO2_12_FULL_59_22]|nr:MAG: phytochrome sensor protein [Gallionellales bacterium RIFCSPLOWO2_02_FULL_59_110]OGT03812.1 MAG: phytochrome sensor protein [Gallionellales bacterium RIFCSPLOWO2_02_58_13]OGT10183.1 MAG: phytochrome sensor protein [Gallionellales bacterium RIFCSPLOWO2_12_FULL_59_22]
MRADDVAQYLQNNPQFFEEHIETLTQITLPHPHGGRTVSLSERQLLALREKNRELEKKLHELIEFAKDNDALQHKVHEFVVALFAARDLATLQEMIPHLLREIFAVPHSALRMWQINPPGAELLAFADAQAQPVCLHHAAYDTAGWFGEHAAQLHSFAYLPLHAGSETIGLLVLASEDRQRFYPEMGTVFLQRLAEAVSSALHPYLAQ